MSTVLIVASIIVLAMVGLCALVFRWADARVKIETQARDHERTILRDALDREHARVEASVAIERTMFERFEATRERQADAVTTERNRLEQQHAAEIERLRALYDQMLTRQAEGYEKASEKLANMMLFGQPTRPVAEVGDREPDADARVARQVSEQTVKRMADFLWDQYKELGIPVTRDDCVNEARQTLYAEAFVPSDGLREFITGGSSPSPVN